MSNDKNNKDLGSSVENVENKVSKLAKSLDYLAARMPEISAAASSIGNYYKDAGNLKINISDRTDTLLKELKVVYKRLNEINKGKIGEKDKEKDPATGAGVCVCRFLASSAAAAVGGVDTPVGAGGGASEAGALAKATAEGGQEYATKAGEQIDSQGEIEKKDKDMQVAAEKKMWAGRVSAAGRGAGMMANIMQNLYQATGQKSKAMFAAMKAFAIAETVIQTYRAAQGAYAVMAKVHPALGVAAAAVAIAAGMARVKAIAATKPAGATGTVSAGGRANPSYGGGSFNAYPVPQRNEEEPKQAQQITLNIYNPLSEQNWAEIAENNIIPALNDASDRNINLVVKTIAA